MTAHHLCAKCGQRFTEEFPARIVVGPFEVDTYAHGECPSEKENDIMDNSDVRIWCVGADTTEYYAARSVEELREWYKKNVGEPESTQDFVDHFEEVPQSSFDNEFDINDDGVKTKSTWRKLLEGAEVPGQVLSGYL